jgi:hypothetical protein
MMSCPQFEGMNVYEHGVDVHARFTDLYLHLTQGTPLQLEWRLSEWINDPKIVKNLLPFETLKMYQIYHDCGKPFCRVVDANGKQHFPNHAEVSYQTWMKHAEVILDGHAHVSPEDEQIGKLIRMDMDVHTLKGDAINEFIQCPEAASLLLTGLAEIHSNAAHLGQMNSDQFKIKLKQLDKIGKKLVAALK